MKALPRIIFMSRWLQVPLYLGPIVAQGVYVVLFLKEVWHFVTHAMTLDETNIMLVVLGLIDVVTILNLLIMVIVGGYETFVSRAGRRGPSGRTGMARSRQCGRTESEAVDGAHQHFVDPSAEDLHQPGPAHLPTILWQVIIHVAFLVSALIMAYVDRLTTHTHPRHFHDESFVPPWQQQAQAAKGGGSENKSKFAMLNPSDSIVDWVLKTVPTMGADWCPPGMLGIGGTAEKAMVMAKESLMNPIGIQDIIARGPQDWIEELRVELHEKVNALGIGAQGLGGLATVLDVKIMAAPPHAASKPIATIPNCAATRHAHFTLDGSGVAKLEAPSLDAWPDVTWQPNTETSKRVDLNTLTSEEVASWKPGQTLLLSGKMLTGRDAAHKRIADMLARDDKLPVDFTNRVIYYVGPVDPVRDEAVGPAGPTTATRMDKFTEMMLAQTGLISIIGRAERSPVAIEAIKNYYKAAYLMAVGGAAYLVSKAIREAKVLAFQDLSMEAIYEFDVQDIRSRSHEGCIKLVLNGSF